MADNNRTDSGALTNWYVITGAPCSGKTAVINQLADQGFRIVPEVARAYIDAQLAQGLSLADIKADLLAFERRILMEKVRIEKRLPTEAVVFLDRAVPDSIAYYELEALGTDEPVQYSKERRYCKVFLLKALEFEKDAVRTENQTLSATIEALLKKAYTTLGYKIVHVPVMSVARRVEFILSQSKIS